MSRPAGMTGQAPDGSVVLKRPGGPGATLQISVPADLVRRYDLQPGQRFRPEVTDEGILYRAVEPMPRPDPRPEWQR